MIEKQLTSLLFQHLPQHSFQKVCSYLFKNPGKFFRPKLIYALGEDLKIEHQSDLLFLSAFVEIHHTYTLIHDDLPPMDNDDIRRGKASTHKKFTEADAILAGDALLITSFSCLSRIQNTPLSKLFNMATWATGGKGLIAGQYFDLKKNKKSYEELLRIHELKTARLFQCCSLGTFFLSSLPPHHLRNFMRLGSLIGIIFQIIDDLDDLKDTSQQYNNLAFLDYSKAKQQLKNSIKRLSQICENYQLEKTYQLITSYAKSQNVIF